MLSMPLLLFGTLLPENKSDIWEKNKGKGVSIDLLVEAGVVLSLLNK